MCRVHNCNGFRFCFTSSVRLACWSESVVLAHLSLIVFPSNVSLAIASFQQAKHASQTTTLLPFLVTSTSTPAPLPTPPPNLPQQLPRLLQTNNIHPPTTTPPRLPNPPQPLPHRPRRKAHLPPQRALQNPAPRVPPPASEAHTRGSGTAGEGDYFHGQSE